MIPIYPEKDGATEEYYVNPCPLCGNKPAAFYQYNVVPSISCENCGLSIIQGGVTMLYIVELWNHITEPRK